MTHKVLRQIVTSKPAHRMYLPSGATWLTCLLSVMTGRHLETETGKDDVKA